MSTWLRTCLALLVGLLAVAVAPAASANVDDFSYASWTSEYEISLDDNGRAQAHVTETLVARFPEYDQNRGIVRGLETRYEGAHLGVNIVSITDENGNAVPYDTESEDGTLYLLLGDDEFQHGLTTYVIEYTMRDVILAATETGNDEFYWSLLPLRSTQAIEQFEGHITFSSEMSAALNTDYACYYGRYGSRDRCDLSVEQLADGGSRYSVSAEEIPAGYGVTVAIGMDAGTASQPMARTPNAFTDVVPFALLGAGGLTAMGGGIAMSSFRKRRRVDRGIIVAQYDVPDELPPLLAAAVYPGARSVIPAEIVHLAVSGIVRIEERDEKTLRPRLRLLKTDIREGLDDHMVSALFRNRTPDATMTMPKSSETFAKRMTKMQGQGVKAAEERGLMEKERSQGARIFLRVTFGLAILASLLSLVGVFMGREDAAPKLVLTIALGVAVTVLAAAFSVQTRVHTQKGAEAYEYLSGVREFIRVAEADRIQMLQSHYGAERYTEGSVEVVHLYERLLPYAMLFGMEKSWGKVLEVAYATSASSPNWMTYYTANSFASQLRGFSSGAQSSASYSSSSGGSSSGGGSTGGGFSGGGGGGGFSGGR